MKLPHPLKPGHTIGICSPAGASTIESLEAAVHALEARAYHVIVADNAAAAHENYDYLAGEDALRIADLNQLIRDPDVDLIICARGGYGTMRLLDGIDYDALAADPKPIVGYSDITALNLAVAAKAGVVSYSGIMASSGSGFGQATLDAFSEASFWAAVGDYSYPRTLNSSPDSAKWKTHRGKENLLTGRLYPVCLSLLCSLLGTPYIPDLHGAILLIEDVTEELYAIDRYLTQLRLGGYLENLNAILIGSFNGFEAEKNTQLANMVPELVLDLAPSHLPVVSGIEYGHIARRLTLPVGANTVVDIEKRSFTYSED